MTAPDDARELTGPFTPPMLKVELLPVGELEELQRAARDAGRVYADA